MQTIARSTPTADANAEFTEGTAQGGKPATLITAEWLNTIQRELMALLAASGITPKDDDNDQVLEAILGLFGAYGVGVELGGAVADFNAITRGGLYRSNGTKTENMPTVYATSAAVLLVHVPYTAAGALQIAGGQTADGTRLAWRVRVGGTWAGWVAAVGSTGDQSIDGLKTFIKSIKAATPATKENSDVVATTAFVSNVERARRARRFFAASGM